MDMTETMTKFHEQYDNVNHPKHYEDGCSIECIHMMWTVLGLNGVIMFCIGNAYKYLWRHKLKNNPEEDLAKAKWYIDEAFEMMGDLCDEDRDTYEMLFPRLCEVLRVHNLYSAKNHSNVKIEDLDGDIDDDLYDEDGFLNFLKQRDKEAENAIKEQQKRKDEDRKDWEQVYHDINTIFNNLPTECILDHDINIEIDRALAISKKHCQADS